MNTKPIKPSASIALAIALALAMTAGGTTAANAQQGGGCLDKRQIQEAINSGQVVSQYEALEREGYDSSYTLLDFQLCDRGGRLVYIVQLQSPSLELQNVTLDAQ